MSKKELQAMTEAMAKDEKEAIEQYKKKLAEDIATTFENWKRDFKINQHIFAELIGSSQPRVSNIIQGKVDSFTVDKLLGFCFRLNLSSNIQSKPLKNMKAETKRFIEELQKRDAA